LFSDDIENKLFHSKQSIFAFYYILDIVRYASSLFILDDRADQLWT